MEKMVFFVLAAFIGYICGAIPFGFIYVYWRKGIDLRDVGSGRTGGTNSLRAAGLKVGIVTAISDALKGFAAVWLARFFLSAGAGEALIPWISVTAGIFAVIGHNWSVFLKWRGGAGTGPNVGWAMAIWPPMFPLAALVMILMMVGVGMASVASLTMGAVIPVAFLVLYLADVPGYSETIAYIVGGFVTLGIVAWALRPNIKRLLEGNERVVGPRAKRLEKKAKANEMS
ncbi:MAG TPA: glycerol-3-phosphate acyltransferase [Chloroflexota bacterium]|nr:glycerol-3-phosphate acyltransferase [Chloroflexota bacterium]